MLNKIHQILYYLYPAKEITKKVYNNILSSIKLQNKMDTIFLNSGYSKIPDPHRLLIKLSDKIPLKKRVVNILLYQILGYTMHGKKFKNHTKTINFKNQLQRGVKILNHLMDQILY